MMQVRITNANLVLSAPSIAGIVCMPLSLSPLTSLMSQMVELLKAHNDVFSSWDILDPVTFYLGGISEARDNFLRSP